MVGTLEGLRSEYFTYAQVMDGFRGIEVEPN